MDAKERARKRTRKACTACRKAKTSCSDQRPCTRCVRLKKEDQCIDIPASSSMSDRDRETWVRVATFLRDPASMPPHVAEALEQQVSVVLADPAGSPEPSGRQQRPQQQQHDQQQQQLALHPPTGAADEEVRRLREANEELQGRLQQAMAKLEREQSVQHSFYFFGLTAGTETVAVSHWSFPSTQLMHYNAQFRELAQRDDAELSAPNFTCKRLFMEAFVQRCVKILMFLSHGTVSSMTVPQVWKNSRGEPVNVMSMVYIEVDRESGHVAKIMMASTPAGEASQHHKFDTAFIPSGANFRSNSPMNQMLLEECREGIMQQIFEARATPPAAAAQGWGGGVSEASAIAVTSAASPQFNSPELYHSSSPSSASSAEGLDDQLAMEPMALGYGQLQQGQVASWPPQEQQIFGVPTAPASALAEPVPAAVRFMPQSRVTEMLKADLSQAPWADASPEREARVPSLPLPAFPMPYMQQADPSFAALPRSFTEFDKLQA